MILWHFTRCGELFSTLSEVPQNHNDLPSTFYVRLINILQFKNLSVIVLREVFIVII